jgi:hypothetical protein
MKVHWAAAAGLLLALGCAGVSHARTIEIRTEGTAKFDVIYHRATSNVTGAVIGGLIGAGIQAGIESDQDAKKREPLVPHVTPAAWREVFVTALDEALTAKGIEPKWLDRDDRPAGADIYLLIQPGSYGFRVVDSATMLMSAYVEFEAAYSKEPLKGRNKPPREVFYVTDRKQVPYSSLVQEPATLDGEIRSVLTQAARRLANKIAYNVK